ncbi:inactive serine/threonine-protein kinase TEX14-like [Dendropsophus ebraccatus]|uniref:inactive serine/threonine-protein kinase TEX14-like n=1 Tax=Dendropsophus ebraccatus TaxID=150705 RepID=UPI00383121C1
METLLHILLQMTEALVFLHWRGFIHRSFSSHAIQICSGDRAKLSNLEYMVESKEKTTCDGIIYFPIPKQLYRWSSPEVVAEKTVSVKSDLYSFCTVMQESLTDALPWHGVDDKAVKDSMVLGHYLTADPTLSEPYYSIVSTGIQARPQERTTHLQDIGYLLKNNFKQVLDKVPCTKPAPMVVEAGKDLHGTEQETAPDRFQEITDQFYKSTNITSYHCSSAVSYTESQSETLCDMVEETDEMMAHLPPLENKGQTRPENFYRENVVSPSASSSLLSDCETGTSSDSEEDDIDCSSLETNENWQVELQALDNRLNSIQVHNKPTLGNLQYIQMFLQERNTVLYAEEEQKEPKKLFVEENEFPPDVTFKVKHALPVYSSKSHAKGPPLHYIPPDGSLCSRIDITSATRRRPSEIVEKTKEMALKKVEWCAGLGSPKEKTVKQLYSGQDLWQSAEKSSEQNQADDEVMRHQSYPYSAQERQSKKLAKEIQLSSILKSDSRHLQSKKLCEHVWDSDKEEQAKQEQKSNKDRCEYGEETKLEKVFRHFAGRKYQSPENEEDCEISVGMNPPQASMVKSKGSDDSNVSTETSYFTAETDVSGEKMEQKTLDVCDESDQSLGPCFTMCFDKTLVTWTGERAAQKNIPGHTSIGSSTNTSSTIDVEELSSISCNQKSSLLPFTTPRNTESSARHSTPMSPGKQMLGAISKIRSSQENQRRNPKSFNEKSLASQPSSYNIFSKTSESFLSSMCNSKDYVSLHQEERLPMNDQNASINPIKSGSEDAALPGPQDLSNKTDLQCQSMEITCLISETICSHSKSGQHI